MQSWLISWWSIVAGFLATLAGWLIRRRSLDPWQPIRWFARVTTANVRLTYREQAERDLGAEMEGLRQDLSRALADNDRLRQELSRLGGSGAGSTGSAGAKNRSRSSTRRSRR